MLSSALLLSFYCYVLWLSHNLNVSERYRAYYIERTLSDWKEYSSNDDAGFILKGFPKLKEIHGLSRKEEWGRWSDAGVLPSVRFVFAEDLPDIFTLELEAIAFAPNIDKPLTIRIGSKTRTVSIPDGSFTVSVNVNLEGEKCDTIEFIPPAPTSPKELRLSNDGRKLGIGFIRMCIAEAEGHIPRNSYTLGKSVSFNAKGANAIYTTHGWSSQEETHRWTEGPKAGLSFVISDDMAGKDVLLRLKAHAYLGGGRPYQTVDVFANGQQVTAWEMKDLNWYETHIPIKLLKEGVLNLEFTISDPTAPSDVGESKDARKLGIAALELVIEAQK